MPAQFHSLAGTSPPPPLLKPRANMWGVRMPVWHAISVNTFYAVALPLLGLVGSAGMGLTLALTAR